MIPAEDCNGKYEYTGDFPTCNGNEYYNIRYWKKSLSFNYSDNSIDLPAEITEEKKVEITYDEYQSLPK